MNHILCLTLAVIEKEREKSITFSYEMDELNDSSTVNLRLDGRGLN